MTPEETARYRAIALRHVSRITDAVGVNEQDHVLAAVLDVTAHQLMLLAPDRAEAVVSLAVRRARLNAAIENGTQPESIDDVIAAYCRRHKVSEEDLLSHRRTANLWSLRLGLYELLDNKGWTRVKIGERLYRDASTITQGLQGLKARRAAA